MHYQIMRSFVCRGRQLPNPVKLFEKLSSSNYDITQIQDPRYISYKNWGQNTSHCLTMCSKFMPLNSTELRYRRSVTIQVMAILFLQADSQLSKKPFATIYSVGSYPQGWQLFFLSRCMYKLVTVSTPQLAWLSTK